MIRSEYNGSQYDEDSEFELSEDVSVKRTTCLLLHLYTHISPSSPLVFYLLMMTYLV